MKQPEHSELINSTLPAQDTNPIFRIQDSNDSMPKTYRKIANYILENPDSPARFTISQLAKKMGVYPSSITRFCQFLGYSGYPQFKYSAAQRSDHLIQHISAIDDTDSLAEIKQKLLTNYNQGLEKVMQALTPQIMDQVVSLLLQSNRVYFFSHGGSSTSAQLGQILLMQIGIPTSSFTEISLAAMAAMQLKQGDVAIGISSSGNAKTPVDALQIARRKGATTIGISGFSNTHLAYYSDILLCYNLDVEDTRLMHVSRICETAVLGIIQNWLLKKLDTAKSSQDLQNAKQAFMSARYI